MTYRGVDQVGAQHLHGPHLGHVQKAGRQHDRQASRRYAEQLDQRTSLQPGGAEQYLDDPVRSDRGQSEQLKPAAGRPGVCQENGSRERQARRGQPTQATAALCFSDSVWPAGYPKVVRPFSSSLEIRRKTNIRFGPVPPDYVNHDY